MATKRNVKDEPTKLEKEEIESENSDQKPEKALNFNVPS
jgi:hypothetical protein